MTSSYYGPEGVPTKICPCTGKVIPIADTCFCGEKGSPVLLCGGFLSFSLPEISSSAIGSGSFSFSMNYLNIDPSLTSSDGTVGGGFNFTQNLRLVPSGSDVILQLAEQTQEKFTSTGGGTYSSAANNTAAVLSRTGAGSAADQFTLVSRAGVVSQWWGFDPSIATPGRLKSFTDRYGNTQTQTWGLIGGQVRLLSLTDSYGRPTSFTYDSAGPSHRLLTVTDFLGRQTSFQYDSAGHLIVVVGPSITRGADNNANTFPNGTAYVFQYDLGNVRPERRNDLIKIWYPNQVAPFIDSTRTVNVAAVYGTATPRETISYYNDPTDAFHYGKVQQVVESPSGSGAIGSGAYGYMYVNSGLPANVINPLDPIVSRTIETDRNGNQVVYDFNAGQMLVHKQVFATRSKNSLEAHSWETWTAYNTHNQPVRIIMPEGNTVAYTYEDETNTIQFSGVAYARRIGLMSSMTRLPGNSVGIPSRAGSNGQTQLTQLYFYDPIFNRQCAVVEERGNPIDSSNDFFAPQNGGATPTLADRSRYATFKYFDYQKDTLAAVTGDGNLQAQLGLSSTQIGQLIDFVNKQMNVPPSAGPLPLGFQMALGDINGDGTGNGVVATNPLAAHAGNAVKVQSPSVRQLVPNTGGGDPWAWQTQVRADLYTYNALGQQTTHTDPEGNATAYVRYPQNDPEGASQFFVPTLSSKQYGFIKEVHVDVDPATVMTLIGADGDMLAFSGNIIARTNTPGVYQNLVTRNQGGASGGCTSCAYDPLGNPLSTTDTRGNTTAYDRNELGEVYRTAAAAPYGFHVETFYDANRNVTRVDTQDMAVQYVGNDPSDPNYAQILPTGSGSTANLPMQPGAGGPVRPGWFSNLYTFDLLDNPITEDLDATGSTPSSLITASAFDFNQNLIKVTRPLGNTIESDYDERNLRFATRVGGASGSVTVQAFDGNGNLIDVVGPAAHGTTAQSLTVVINDAFNGSTPLVHTGDYIAQNIYDGFDRLIQVVNAVGGQANNTFDPGGRAIATQQLGTSGGATPTDRSGSANVTLNSRAAYFDEAGRAYDNQQSVFLNTGISGSTPTHNLPSARAATHAGGGLAVNSTANGNIATVTLTTGGSSYVLGRSVYDRAGRVTASATDNGAIATVVYDGANRQLSVTDALGNLTQSTFDPNGNVIRVVRTDKCTIPSVTATETFISAMRYDVLNRLVVMAAQGPDGSFNPALNTCCAPPASPNLTLFTLHGYDSRGNQTSLADSKQNTTIWTFDGSGRKLTDQRQLRTGGAGNNPVYDTVLTQTAYDANGNTLRLVDDNGGTTAYTFDAQDRQITMTFHDGSTRTYGYDLASDVTGFTDENGSIFTSAFDVLGRRTSVGIAPVGGIGGTTAQNFQFDGRSRMTFARDTVVSTSADAGFTYDSLGRTLEEQQTYAGSSASYITHTAWTGLPATGFTFPSTRQLTLTFDALYRKNGVVETSGGASIAAWQFFGGRAAEAALGNGVIATWMNNARTRSAVQSGVPLPAWGDQSSDRLGYDGSGRMVTKRYLKATTGAGGYSSTLSVAGQTTGYDPSGNKLFERALHAPDRSSLYPSYDSMDRLLQYQRGTLAGGGGSISSPTALPNTNAAQSYALDGLGNWSSTTLTPQGGASTIQNRTHNRLNEVIAFGVLPASTPVLYDGNTHPGVPVKGNGNITNDGTRLYAFDALNRVLTVKLASNGNLLGSYAYDALGRRIQKTASNGGLSGSVPNGTTRFLYDAAQCVEELSGTTTTSQYVWGHYIDEQIQMKTYASSGPQPLAAGVYYLLSDLLYRSVALTNSSGAVVEAYDADAYGNTLLFSGPGADGVWFTDDDAQAAYAANRYVFTGREYDFESGIYFYRARYYQPQLGRFIGRDPAGYRDEMNIFGYAHEQSTRYIDPFGLTCTQWDQEFQEGADSGWAREVRFQPGTLDPKQAEIGINVMLLAAGLSTAVATKPSDYLEDAARAVALRGKPDYNAELITKLIELTKDKEKLLKLTAGLGMMWIKVQCMTCCKGEWKGKGDASWKACKLSDTDYGKISTNAILISDNSLPLDLVGPQELQSIIYDCEKQAMDLCA